MISPRRVPTISASRWVRYLAAAGAAAGSSASAAVVYWNPVDVTDPPGGPGFIFDMVSGEVSPIGTSTSLTFFEVTNYSTANYVQLIASGSLNNAAVGGDQMARLASGSPIGPASAFGGLQYTYFDNRNAPGFPWNTDLDGTTGYLGLRFAIGADIHYAWAHFTYDDATTGNITLHDFAYENVANRVILAGDTVGVPEPSGCWLLAMGAAGVLAKRQRRRAAASCSR